ncbi:MAG TPA: FG-GAP-like repeat-containing protein [Candidatus Sulfotelmatobacter sp.]
MLKRTISGLCFFLLLGGLMAHAGQFQDAPQYAVGTNPQAVAVGDFNNDGILDMAVVNSGSNNVSVLLGNGDGTFTAKPPALTTGSTPYGIVAGDFDGDGNLDLAVTNSGSNSVSVFMGHGDGTFGAGTSTAVGTTPQGIAVADFNGDGNLDLVVANSVASTYQLLLGNGAGTFAAQTAHNTLVNGPTSIVVGDFNNDGHPDFAIACKSSTASEVVVLLNTAAALGTFTLSAAPVTGIPVSITAGDFDGDGNLDLAVASQPISPSIQGTVNVLYGSPTGAFGNLATYDIGSSPGISSSPTSVATGHFTNSGKLDLVVTAGNDNTLNLLAGNGSRILGFGAEVKFGTGATPYSAVVGDFNNDGKSDVIVANSGAASASVLLGNGNGSFQTRVDAPAGPNVNAVVVGDFNGDGVPDLAFANGDCSGCSANSISVILGNNDGTFKAPNTYSTTIGTADVDTYALVTADFDGDGVLDIAAVNNATNQVAILLGDGHGAFSLLNEYSVGTAPAAITVGDFNQDGIPDLVVANNGSSSISVLIGNGDGTFKTAVPYTVGSGPFAVARGNFNADSFPDLVVVNETGATITILLNNGDGTFTSTHTYATGLSAPGSVAVGTFNADSNLDLAIGDTGSAKVAIFLGNGDGSFSAAVPYATGANVYSLVAHDFNADGFTDLAFAGQVKTAGTVNVAGLLTGKGDGTFNTGTVTLFPVGAEATAEAQSIAWGDFNNDGAPDVVVANGLSSTASVLLNSGGTQMSLGSSAGNPSYGTPLTFTATIAPSVPGAGTLTGTVTFENGSTPLGPAAAITNGVATLTTSTLPVGTNTISAIYSGNYQPHTVSNAQVVSKAGTTTTLSPLAAVNVGQSVTITATVCPGAGCPPKGVAPTGTVTFLDGASAIGTGAVATNGQATFTTSSLAAGTHSITASYPGDTNYVASVSPAGNLVVAASGFTLGASALSPGSVSAGASSTSTVTITAAGGLDPTTVALSCTVTGPTTSKPPTCSFGTISASGTATLTVSTTAPTTAMAAHHTSFLYAMWLLFPATVFGTILLPKQKRAKLMMFAAILFISAGCVFQSACGGGSPKTTTTPPTTVPGTASGAYSITVTGSATGVTSQTAAPLTLTVQ